MTRTSLRTAAAALAFSLAALTAPAHAAGPLDESNSASAVGSPFDAQLATSRPGVGASPADDSNSASARGNPLTAAVATTSARYAAATDDSNSASALGGPGTGPYVRPASTGLLALNAR